MTAGLLKVERLCEDLIPWSDAAERKEWRKNVEKAVDLWADNCSSVLGPSEKIQVQEGTADLSINKLIQILRGPLLDLEKRASKICGAEELSKFLDEINENVSVNGEEVEQKMAVNRWKKQIHLLNTFTSRAGFVRESIIKAILLARKGGLKSVTSDLQNALKLFRPNSAVAAKTEALAILERYGGYVPLMDDEENDEEEEGSTNNDDVILREDKSNEVQSKLTDRALSLTACLNLNKDIDQNHWRTAVKHCKTLSKFSALLHTFLTASTEILESLQDDQENLYKAIASWQSEILTPSESRRKKGKMLKYDITSNVWIPCKITSELVWAKQKKFPWLPAHICEVFDSHSHVARTLEKCNRVVIKFVGAKKTHVANRANELKSPYTVSISEDLTRYDEDTISKLKECMDMARRMCRTQGIKIQGK